MEEAILPILIITNRFRSEPSFLINSKLFHFDQEKGGKGVMLLPRWPAPAGRGQRDGPWPHSDTFSITKKNNSSQTKKKKQNMNHKGRQEGVEGDLTGLAVTC